MASIFRRSWWVSEKGKQCRSDTPGARKRRAKKWTIMIKGKHYPGHRDKAATLQRAARLEKQIERKEEGLLDPYEQYRNLPLKQHVDVWVEELEGRGRSEVYVPQSRSRLYRLIDECKWKTLGDVNAESFIRWRGKAQTNASHNATDAAQAKHERMGARTQNHYLQAAQAFFNWAIKRGRWGENPLKHVEKVDETRDLRRTRRALTANEVTRLLAVVDDDYALVYEFALRTGLRRAEIRAIRWADLHLDCPTPYVEVRAAIAKNRRTDALPIRSDLAKRLLEAKADADEGARVFRWVPTIKRHKRYLEAAGIPYVDALGRRVDWHAMRTTFGTMLSTAGIAPRIAMELLRHSDLRLTMRVYTDAKVLDLSGAVEKLPAMAPHNRA